MPDPSTLGLFITASLILLFIPGPAVLYIVARSIDQGRLAGIVSVLGITTGTFFHVTAAALGITAILVASALAFNMVKYLGAVYLIYLGLKKLISQNKNNAGTEAGAFKNQKMSVIFYQGILVNVLNPKTALFFFAFLPQFANPSTGNFTIQILFLGLIFISLGVVSDSLYALLAGSLGKWLKSNTHFLTFHHRIAGCIYILLGFMALAASPDTKK